MRNVGVNAFFLAIGIMVGLIVAPFTAQFPITPAPASSPIAVKEMYQAVLTSDGKYIAMLDKAGWISVSSRESNGRLSNVFWYDLNQANTGSTRIGLPGFGRMSLKSLKGPTSETGIITLIVTDSQGREGTITSRESEIWIR